MAKQVVVEKNGIVMKVLSDAQYRVQLEEGNAGEILAYASGRICRSKAHRRILVGDRVKVELSPYDLTRGRITHRYRTQSS